MSLQFPVRVALLWAFLAGAAFGQSYVVSRVAGTVLPPSTVPPTSVSVTATAVAVDGSGNVYIADQPPRSPLPAAVLKLDSKGVLTPFAGTGPAGFSGDGGPAVDAQLSFPSALVLDGSGNLYIGDNSRIRRVSTSGIITTVAGSNSPVYSGDGGPAIGAGFYAAGLAVDAAGNLYIADLQNCRIREVTTDGAIRTIAGTGAANIAGDGGPAIQAAIGSVNAIALDHAGNIYFAASSGTRASYQTYVRKISTAGIVTTIAGTGIVGTDGDGGFAVNAQLLGAESIAIDGAGNIYIGDSTRVRKISTDGTIATVVGAVQGGVLDDGVPATSAAIMPEGLAVDSSGSLFIAESYFPVGYRVRKVSQGIIATVAGNGFEAYSGDGGPAILAQLSAPNAAAADNAGNLYIADWGNNRIRKVSPGGTIATVDGNGGPGSPFDGQPAASGNVGTLSGLVADGHGNVFFSDGDCSCIWKITADGVVHLFAGGHVGYGGDGGPALQAGFLLPEGLALDSAGNLYIADTLDNRVRKVSVAGTVSTVAGNGLLGPYSGEGGQATAAVLSSPQSVALDAQGNLYISSTNIARVLKVSPAGIITTVAGNGTFGHSGDGGAATAAQLDTPAAVACDASGNLFIAEQAAIRRVSTGGTISTIASGISPQAIAADAAGNVYEVDGSNVVNLVRPASPPAVASAASNIAGAISPGEIVTIYGSAMGPVELAKATPGSDGFYPTQVAGTVVTVNGIAAPLIYTWGTQVAAVVPYEITGVTAQVMVTYQGQAISTLSVPIGAAVPAIFTADSSGTGQAAAVNQDNSINSTAKPAHVGDVITLFATGEGQTSPTGVDGKPAAQPLPRPVLPVTVTIGGQTAQVQYAGGAPGEVAGVMQVNVTIPSGIQTGSAVPVVLQVGTAASPAGVTLAVQ